MRFGRGVGVGLRVVNSIKYECGMDACIGFVTLGEIFHGANSSDFAVVVKGGVTTGFPLMGCRLG